MTKKTFKNVSRFSLPVVIKSLDGSKTNSFMLAPQKTFEATDTQMTGDIATKLTNKLLKVISEVSDQGATTEFLKIVSPVKIAPKPVASKATSKVTSHTTFSAGNKEVRMTTKETDNS